MSRWFTSDLSESTDKFITTMKAVLCTLYSVCFLLALLGASRETLERHEKTNEASMCNDDHSCSFNSQIKDKYILTFLHFEDFTLQWVCLHLPTTVIVAELELLYYAQPLGEEEVSVIDFIVSLREEIDWLSDKVMPRYWLRAHIQAPRSLLMLWTTAELTNHMVIKCKHDLTLHLEQIDLIYLNLDIPSVDVDGLIIFIIYTCSSNKGNIWWKVDLRILYLITDIQLFATDDNEVTAHLLTAVESVKAVPSFYTTGWTTVGRGTWGGQKLRINFSVPLKTSQLAIVVGSTGLLTLQQLILTENNQQEASHSTHTPKVAMFTRQYQDKPSSVNCSPEFLYKKNSHSQFKGPTVICCHAEADKRLKTTTKRDEFCCICVKCPKNTENYWLGIQSPTGKHNWCRMNASRAISKHTYLLSCQPEGPQKIETGADASQRDLKSILAHGANLRESGERLATSTNHQYANSINLPAENKAVKQNSTMEGEEKSELQAEPHDVCMFLNNYETEAESLMDIDNSQSVVTVVGVDSIIKSFCNDGYYMYRHPGGSPLTNGRTFEPIPFITCIAGCKREELKDLFGDKLSLTPDKNTFGINEVVEVICEESLPKMHEVVRMRCELKVLNQTEILNPMKLLQWRRLPFDSLPPPNVAAKTKASKPTKRRYLKQNSKHKSINPCIKNSELECKESAPEQPPILKLASADGQQGSEGDFKQTSKCTEQDRQPVNLLINERKVKFRTLLGTRNSQNKQIIPLSANRVHIETSPRTTTSTDLFEQNIDETNVEQSQTALEKHEVEEKIEQRTDTFLRSSIDSMTTRFESASMRSKQLWSGKPQQTHPTVAKQGDTTQEVVQAIHQQIDGTSAVMSAHRMEQRVSVTINTQQERREERNKQIHEDNGFTSHVSSKSLRIKTVLVTKSAKQHEKSFITDEVEKENYQAADGVSAVSRSTAHWKRLPTSRCRGRLYIMIWASLVIALMHSQVNVFNYKF